MKWDGDVFKDPLTDKVGALLIRLSAFPTWTNEKRAVLDALLEQLRSENYLFFWARYRPYLIRNNGDSYLYKVPENKTGSLKGYRGKTIRLIRVGSSTLSVQFAANVVAPELAVILLTYPEV